jgi:multicomponent Na+:H+ antiporter subunit E
MCLLRNGCLRADLDISPALVKVRTTCKSDLAKVTFANSITLTPGTVTVEIQGDKMLVHGLYEANTVPESFIGMDARCARAATRGEPSPQILGRLAHGCLLE